MGSNPKCGKTCQDDMISRLPDAILCHILSFLSTREAVKTGILSHRWKNLWAYVPNLDLCNEGYFRNGRYIRADPDEFAGFVYRVLLFRGVSNIHRFRLYCPGMKDYSHIDAWIRTAVRCNVVELDLYIPVPANPPQSFELPRSLLMCNTLVVLKLDLLCNFTINPTSNCFPSLKFLHVETFGIKDIDSMEKLFSCCPVLEDLIIRGYFAHDSTLDFVVSAPKLKRLQISLLGIRQDADYRNFINASVFIAANAPNLVNLDFRGNFLGRYSWNVKSLSKAKIDLEYLHAEEPYDINLESVDRMNKLFAGIVNVKYLSVSAPILGGTYSVHEYHLPTFNHLNHLELLLQTCCSLRSLTNFLQISPNLEHLVLENNIRCMEGHNVEADLPIGLAQEWSEPDSVPVCLPSRLKTICLQQFQGRPDEMEMVKYLLKHGKVLNSITICTFKYFCGKKMMTVSLLGLKEEMKLSQYMSMLPRGSKTSQIVFPRLA